MDRHRGQRIKFIEKCGCSDSDSLSHDHDKKNMNQNSNSTKSCKVISNLLLPEDLMFHIFTLVPLNCLLNSARLVCKAWAATIGSSYFAEACERSKPGLYVENRKSRRSSFFLEFKDDVNGQFERTDLGTPQRMGFLIGTCDGILLLSNVCSEIVVVNPILKCWLRIPPFPISQHLIVVSHQCILTRVPGTANFKLFLVDVLLVSGAFWYVFYVLRIGIDNSWQEIGRKEAPINWCFCWKPLYSGGNDLYWITTEEVIVMNVDKEIIVREYPLPPMPLFNDPIPIYLWMGNRLSYIAYKNLYTFQIYILDFDSGKWSLYHEMGPLVYVTNHGHEIKIKIMNALFRVWINDQIIFRLALHQKQMGNIFLNKSIHFGYNIKTRQLAKIESIAVGNFEQTLFSLKTLGRVEGSVLSGQACLELLKHVTNEDGFEPEPAQSIPTRSCNNI